MSAPAVVVGVCAHGLAVVRALARAGVTVTALEAREFLPGVRTRWARVQIVEDINGPGLMDALDEVLLPGDPSDLPVLFLTNDNMVRVVAENWERIEGRCRLSWALSRKEVSRLLDKRHLSVWCGKKGLLYPRTAFVENEDDVAAAVEEVGFPMIVKPSRPLSSFKAKLCKTMHDVVSLIRCHPSDFPLLFQEYIHGNDLCLRFGALYMDAGKVVASFEGRKLRSYPTVGGATSVAEPFQDSDMFRMATAFFEGLQMSGPVSIEVKVDREGRMWVIEPTVGRTDYWLDCCVANGVNFPLIEYRHQCGVDVEACSQGSEYIWVDSERDKLWVLAVRHKAPGTGCRIRFSFLASDDLRPFVKAVVLWVQWTCLRVWNRVARAFSSVR